MVSFKMIDAVFINRSKHVDKIKALADHVSRLYKQKDLIIKIKCIPYSM